MTTSASGRADEPTVHATTATQKGGWPSAYIGGGGAGGRAEHHSLFHRRCQAVWQGCIPLLTGSSPAWGLRVQTPMFRWWISPVNLERPASSSDKAAMKAAQRAPMAGPSSLHEDVVVSSDFLGANPAPSIF